MDILFIHQNFPAQFRHLAPCLAATGHRCVALTLRVTQPATWKGVRVLPYALPARSGQNVHPWLIDLDTKVTRAHACFLAARKLRAQGFAPDVILAHPGWGESMFLHDVWPAARIGLYCEFHHREDAPELTFDPEFSRADPEVQKLRLRMKNLNDHIHFPVADAGISPTRFQADSFPPGFRDRITVCHDGIDTETARPVPRARSRIDGMPELTGADEVITFVNRNLEPYRGFHVFMRALPRLLKARPRAQVVIVGGDGTSYGARPPDGRSWKQVFTDEVRGQIADRDWARVHFPGRIPYSRFIRLLQVSRVHVYLTYPFVPSWSLLEAMSCGAAVIASDTAPVREVIRDGETGLLVDFFDGPALVDTIGELAGNDARRAALGRAARRHIVETYDLKSICLPRQLDWISRLARIRREP